MKCTPGRILGPVGDRCVMNSNRTCETPGFLPGPAHAQALLLGTSLIHQPSTVEGCQASCIRSELRSSVTSGKQC